MNNSTLSNKLSNYSIILGSQSPDEKNFCRTEPTLPGRGQEIDENFPAEISAFEFRNFFPFRKPFPSKLILKKNDLLITSDTIVLIDNKILGKPFDYKHAFEMLQLLSGRKHMVITGVCITTTDKQVTFSDRTDVFQIAICG